MIALNDLDYKILKERIYRITKLDLDGYKSQQMRRRLESYINKNEALSVVSYCKTLENDPARVRELLDFLAINVSEFFRDENQFQFLKMTILPDLLKANRQLRMWSAACSCGQEPYSLALTLEEISQNRHSIIGTDIDESALEKARGGGPYSIADVRNVSKLMRTRSFTETANGYLISPQIRTKVEFKKINLLNDAFEQNFDLILCRNVIIYFSDLVRDKLFLQFNKALQPHGVLFLGGSEIMLKPSDYGFKLIQPSFYVKASPGTPFSFEPF